LAFFCVCLIRLTVISQKAVYLFAAFLQSLHLKIIISVIRCSLNLFYKRIWRCPTLPPPVSGSTIGAGELNFRVRDGNGCDLPAMVTRKFDFRDVLRGATLAGVLMDCGCEF
jgi:hypothetical protein